MKNQLLRNSSMKVSLHYTIEMMRTQTIGHAMV